MNPNWSLLTPDLPAIGILMLALLLQAAHDPALQRRIAAANRAAAAAPSPIDLERLASFGPG